MVVEVSDSEARDALGVEQSEAFFKSLVSGAEPPRKKGSFDSIRFSLSEVDLELLRKKYSIHDYHSPSS